MTTTLQERIDNALIKARQLSAEGNTQQATSAWEEVEELLAEASHHPQRTNFEQYCRDNPEADECRIYDV